MFLMDVFFEESHSKTLSSCDTMSTLLFEPAIHASLKLAPRTQHRVSLGSKVEQNSSPSTNFHDQQHRQYRQDLGMAQHSAPSAYQPQRKRNSISALQISMGEIGRSLNL